MNSRSRFSMYIVLVLLAAGIGIAYVLGTGKQQDATVPALYAPDAQTKFSNCTIMGKYPDHACTPGAVIPSATKGQICVSGYSKSVRNVPESEKKSVYAEYGITSHVPGQYEIDHFISLELGGSNDSANLFPEAAEPRPGFHEKDEVENYLHQQVCSGSMSLADAEREIATDWYAVYMKIRQSP